MPGFSMKNMCLDSAMDNLPAYTLLKDWKIRAFIDLNSKCGHPRTIPDTIRLDKNGTPLCQAASVWCQMDLTGTVGNLCGAVHMANVIPINAAVTVPSPNMAAP